MNGRRRGTIGCAAPQGTTSTLNPDGDHYLIADGYGGFEGPVRLKLECVW
ncbi:MAG: hypothetical protein FJ087_02200 [Deltaproteobacteria bacterium]|nr:hypothetical protein [Deltaproteobacteria bacterium]